MFPKSFSNTSPVVKSQNGALKGYRSQFNVSDCYLLCLGQILSFLTNFDLLSANTFNLDKAKIL